MVFPTKRRQYLPRALVLVATLLALAACDSSEDDEVEHDPNPSDQTYANPVMARDFPDPTVIQGGDGAYYAYATETAINGAFTNIQVARSENLVDWVWHGEALPGGVPWAEERRQYWAPDVTYDADRDRYVLFHSARNDEADGHCVTVATSSTPLGPFRPEPEPLRCGSGFRVIDAMTFEDPQSGRNLLYWGSEGQPVRAQEMTDDWTAFAPGSEAREALQTAPGEEYGGLLEGPWVIYRGGRYYMFVSGDNCCGAEAHYAVLVARSGSPEGPFTFLADATDANDSVILEADGTWLAPGHNSVVQGAAGNDWMVYHAIERGQPTRNPGFGGDAEWDRRIMMMDRLRYDDDGWPYVEGETPSETAGLPVTDE